MSEGFTGDTAPPAVFLVGHRTASPAVAARYDAAGLRYFELDVRIVDDRVVVTHHRPVLGSGGLLERDNTRLRLRSRSAPDHTAGEVIAQLPPGSRIVFDPKDREQHLRAQLADALAAMVEAPGRHVVSTRSRRDLEIFAAAGFQTWWTLDTAAQIRRVTRGPLPADGVTVRQRALDAASVLALHRVTTTVVAWTVHTVPRARELVCFGVDGITTHNPAVVAALAR